MKESTPPLGEEARKTGEDGQNQNRAQEPPPVAAASHREVDTLKKAVVFQRYCHVYAKGELERLFATLSPAVEVETSYYDTGNWCVIARKVQ